MNVTLEELLATTRSQQEKIEELERRIAALEKENAELRRRLAIYDIPHSPPSSRLYRRPSTNEPKGEPGREEGHKGFFRPFPTPTKTLRITAEKCPRCGRKLGRPFKVERRVVEEIPKPQPIEVVEYLIEHYECRCGEEVVATHPNLPKEGRFGKNVLAQTTLMKYEDRLPHRKICEALKRQYGLVISPASILDFTRRTSDGIEEDYKKILERIRRAKVVYGDETGLRVNGFGYWIWVFATKEETFVAIRRSRGKKVPKEVLTEEFDGVIVCDGLKAYPNFTNKIQRCWAHLLREAEFVAEQCSEAKPFSRALHRLYFRLTQSLSGDPLPEERRHLHKLALLTLKRWTSKKYGDSRVSKFRDKIRNGLKHWLTFVVTPGVEPTNNIAERALREHVVQRKIFGTLRNEKGTKIHETMMSVFATWEQQGLNPYETLLQRL